MKKSIICGEPTKLDCYDFCEKCFNTPIEELGKKYERRRASQTREDHRETPSREDSCEPFSLK